MTGYRLFEELADQYDRHTPPRHYQHDHDLVLEIARKYGPKGRLLDVGCGTGVLLEKAMRAGMVAMGIDSSREMIRQCETRLGPGIARHERMQDLNADAGFDVVCALSWSLNYVENNEELELVLRKLSNALLAGGTLILQVAHAANATGEVFIDREDKSDVALVYRFVADANHADVLEAQYIFVNWSEKTLESEDHRLVGANARHIAAILSDMRPGATQIHDSWRLEGFSTSVSPFIITRFDP